MPPTRKLLIITGIILFLLLIGFFLARYLKPNTQQIETINLPNIIDKLTPKSGDIDSVAPDPTGGLLSVEDLSVEDIVIKDTNLADGQKKIAEMESTLITYRTRLTEAQTKLSGYQSQINQPQGEEIVETIYGDKFTTEIQKLEQSIEYYNKIIFVYETLVQKFKGSIAYYYCNGFTPKLPGETVDISLLAYNIIIINHTNGTTTQTSCNWDGTPTEFTPDSPYHPANFFDGLPPEFLQNNPFEDVSFNYTTEDQWGDFTPQLTDVVWKSTPPVWYYYLNVFFTLYIDISVNISVDIQGLWKLFFDAYPIDDLTRYENVHVWVDRYKTFANDGKLTVWGLIQTGHQLNSVCPVLRMGTLTNASWHYRLASGKRSINYKDKDTCLLARKSDKNADAYSSCVYDQNTKPDTTNPPQKLKDFFKGILKDIKEQFTLKYYMDGLDPASIQEYPLSVIEATIWTYTTTTNTPSSQYATKSECLSARDINPNANKSIDCKYTFATSTSGSGVWTLWYQQTGMKNSVSRGTFPNKAACEAERTAKFPAQKGTKTECRTVPQSCTSTVPGQSKHWYVLIPDYDPELPYIYDIVDANYRKFDFNWSTFTVQEMAYRYWGPQFVSQLDTQNVFATLMNRLNVSTDELAQRTGLPKRAEPYQSFYNRQDQTFSALFSIQTQADVRVFGSLDNLKNNTFSLPLQLNYSVYDPATGVSKVYPATPTLVSSRPTVQVDQAGNPIPENQINTTTANIRNEYSTVYLYFDGVAGVTAEDRFQLVDTQRQEILVEGAVGEVDSYAESNSLSRFVDWWVYVYKPTPTTEKRSNLYPTQTDCQNAARKQFPNLTPVCFKTVADNIAVFFDISKSKLTSTSGEFSFKIRGDAGAVVPLLKRAGMSDVSSSPATVQLSGQETEFRIQFPVDSAQSVSEYEVINSLNGAVLSSGRYDASRNLMGVYFSTRSDIYETELGQSFDKFQATVLGDSPDIQSSPGKSSESMLPNPLGDTTSIPALVSRYARIVPAFIGLWIVMQIVLLGARMILTDGREDKIQALRSTFRFGGLGVLILLVIYALLASFESLVIWVVG